MLAHLAGFQLSTSMRELGIKLPVQHHIQCNEHKKQKSIASLYIMKQIFTEYYIIKCYMYKCPLSTTHWQSINSIRYVYVSNLGWWGTFRRTTIWQIFHSENYSSKKNSNHLGEICCISASRSTHRFSKFFQKFLLLHCNTRLQEESFLIRQSPDIDKAISFI